MAKVLLVDDSPTVLKVMSVSLMAKGLTVKTAASGKAGLAMAVSESPSVIILDINLPDINGLDILAKLKADPATASIPVIMLTGQDDYTHVERGMSMGAAGYLAKHSTSPKILLEKLRSILGPVF